MKADQSIAGPACPALPFKPDVMDRGQPNRLDWDMRRGGGSWTSDGDALLPPALPYLTEREAHVLELVATGLYTRDIAPRMFVSHQAVTYHIGNLLAKLQAKNRAGLVARAYALGLLTLDWPPRVR